MSAPPPNLSSAERSLNRQLVLEEDEYTAALSHIIARDFFPSLVYLDATNDYLDAADSRDEQRISASVRRLEELSTPYVPGPRQTPSQTPYATSHLETPQRTPRVESSTRPRFETDLRLDTFQARYTSEDNSSFTQILDEENRKRKEQWGWAWEAQRRVEAQRDRMIEAREKMLIEAAPVYGVKETFQIEPPVPLKLLTNDGATESEEDMEVGEIDQRGLEVQVVGESDPSIDVMAPKKDTRVAGVDGWKFKV